MPGESATVTWDRTGDYPAPAVARVVLHGLWLERAVADGVEVPVSGSVVECEPFSVLTLEGLTPARHPAPLPTLRGRR